MGTTDTLDADTDTDLDIDTQTFAKSEATGTTSVLVPAPGFPDGRNKDVKIAELDGHEIFEGDIALGRIGEPGERGLGIVGEHFRWPDGTVPFVADDEVADLARKAMDHWHSQTNGRISFVPRTTEDDFVHFQRLSGSWSYVGRQGDEQTISLGAGASPGTAVHEIGHALGLWHEQSRGDRDNHITILMDKVAPEHQHNFEKHIDDGFDIGNYDFGSIMHYPRTAFSIDGSDTILTKDGQPIGQRQGLSAGDLNAIATLYP